MAIAFDSSVMGGNGSNTFTYAFNNVAGTVVFVSVLTATTSDLVTSVTYGGVTMTRLSWVVSTYSEYFYILQNAPTGNNNVIVTSSAGFVDSSAVSYSGASLTGQPDASANGTVAPGPTVAASLTTIANNCWTVAFCGATGAVMSAGLGTTQRVLGSFNLDIIGDSGGPVSPAGSATLNFVGSGFDSFIWSMASMAPASTSTAYTLTADAGSYAVTGTAATLTAQHRMMVDAGSYLVTGTAATLTASIHTHYTLSVLSGEYLITGTRATLRWSGAPPVTGNFPQCLNIAVMGL